MLSSGTLSCGAPLVQVSSCKSIPAVSRVTLHFCLGSFECSDVSDHFPPGCKDKDAAVTASEGLLLCQDQLCCVVLCGAVMCSVLCCLICLDGSVYSGSIRTLQIDFCAFGIHRNKF